MTLKVCVCDSCMEGLIGDMETPIDSPVTVTDAEADAMLAALDVAVTVTTPDAGTDAGAE